MGLWLTLKLLGGIRTRIRSLCPCSRVENKKKPMKSRKLLAVPAILSFSISGLAAIPSAVADTGIKSATPTFGVTTNTALSVESSTPSFKPETLDLERASSITELFEDGEKKEVAPVVVAAANDYKIKTTTINSEAPKKKKAKKKKKKVEVVVSNENSTQIEDAMELDSGSPVMNPESDSDSSSTPVTRDNVGDASPTTRDSGNDEKSERVFSEANEEALNYDSEETGMEAVVAAAKTGVGSPYVWGGNTPSGWDCSGFVRWAYDKAGIDVARGTSALLASGQFVKTDSPQPGDLIFQLKGKHVGIYLGEGMMVGAQNPSVGTIIHSTDVNPLYGYYTLKK